jgi:hypothetical protein
VHAVAGGVLAFEVGVDRHLGAAASGERRNEVQGHHAAAALRKLNRLRGQRDLHGVSLQCRTSSATRSSSSSSLSRARTSSPSVWAPLASGPCGSPSAACDWAALAAPAGDGSRHAAAFLETEVFQQP